MQLVHSFYQSWPSCKSIKETKTEETEKNLVWLCDAIKTCMGRSLYREAPTGRQWITMNGKITQVITYDRAEVTLSKSQLGVILYNGLSTNQEIPFESGIVIVFGTGNEGHLFQQVFQQGGAAYEGITYTKIHIR